MATDELTAQLNRENMALREALELATLSGESWHAVSSWNIKRGRTAVIDQILCTAADKAGEAARS